MKTLHALTTLIAITCATVASAQLATGDILVSRKTAGGMQQYPVTADVRDLLLAADVDAMRSLLDIDSGAVPDGDYGDVTVSSGAWSVDAGVISASKLAATLDLSGKTLTLPSDVTRLGTSIDLASEVTGSLPWGSISSKPTTLAGYGIVDGITAATVAAGYQPLALVLTNTTAAFTTPQETKLAGIAPGAEVNVNADWTATSGDAQILNKPVLGTMAAEAAANYLTTAAAASAYASLTGSYSNPAWITALAWSKITGAPSFLLGNQTITLTGAVTGSGATSITTTLAADQARANLTGGTGALNLSAFSLTLPTDVTRLGTSIDLASEVTGILPWASVSKVSSSLADLATRSASDLSSGTLPDARFPTTLPALSGANLTNLDPHRLQQRGASNGQALVWSTANNRYEPATLAGTGDALTSGSLAQFGATTSGQLRGVLSDETGTGEAVFSGGNIGSAAATTPPVADNDTSVATTAFVVGALSPGGISGLTLSNNVTVPAARLNIAAGAAVSDDGTAVIKLTSDYVKRIDANWAVGGSAEGGRTGPLSGNNWYHVYVIMRADTGVVDVIMGLASTSITLPSNYTHKRRIGYIFYNGAASIEPFEQLGDYFYLSTPTQDINITATATSQLVTVRCPPNALALISGRVSHASAARSIYISSPLTTDVAASVTLLTAQTTAAGATSSWQQEVAVNSSSQVRIVANGLATIVVGITRGWIDQR